MGNIFKVPNKSSQAFGKKIIPLFCLGIVFVWAETAIMSPANDNLLISQVQITEGDKKTTHDFVELFNPTARTINLKGYRLVKRAKGGLKDSNLKSWDEDRMVEPGSYFLWASSEDVFYPASIYADFFTKTTIANDNGIALRFGPSDTGAIIDVVAWGSPQNAFAEKEAYPANPGEGQSLERKARGVFTNAGDTDNNKEDFVIVVSHPRNSQSGRMAVDQSVSPGVSAPTPPVPAVPSVSRTPTPTLASTVSLSPTVTMAITPIPAAIVYPREVVINEFLPDPSGNDEDGEWIELYNGSNQDVNLDDWRLDDEIGKGSGAFKISQTSIKAHGYAVFSYQKSGVTLNNDGGEVNLIWPDGTLAQKISYSKAPVGEVYASFSSGWFWSKKPTPGEENVRLDKMPEIVPTATPSKKPVRSSDAFLSATPSETAKEAPAAGNKAVQASRPKPAGKSVYEQAYALKEDAKGASLAEAAQGLAAAVGVEDSLLEKEPVEAADSGMAISAEERGGDKSFIPYLFLAIGLGIILALGTLKVREFFRERQKKEIL